MYNIKSITVVFIICRSAVHYSLAENVLPAFKLVHNNLLPDTLQFTAESDQTPHRIDAIKCGNSVYFAEGTAEQKALITGLSPCKLHECTIEVRNTKTFEKFIHLENITTGFRNTTPPIKLLNIIPESYSIRIDIDFHQIDCIDSFYLMVDSSKVILYTKHNLTKTLNITGLIPCVKYHVFILFNHQTGPYTVLNDVIQTAPLKLGSIENIQFNQEKYLLTWAPPDFPAKCTLKYMITVISEASGETLVFDSDTNSYNLNVLDDCSKFEVKIQPKWHNELLAKIHLATGYKTRQNLVQNLQVSILLNKTALSIKWTRPTKYSACSISYAIQVNGVWSIATSQEHLVPVCNNLQNYKIYVCAVTGWRTLDNCLNYNIVGADYNQSVDRLNQSTDFILPSLYRLDDWGKISNYDSVLEIDKITSASNSHLTLTISELNCGENLVPTYKIFENSNNFHDKCVNLTLDGCKHVCTFSKIPDKIQLQSGVSVGCDSADRKLITLKENVSYEIMARIITPTGYTDTNPIIGKISRQLTNQTNKIWFCLLVVCIGILITLVVVLGINYRKRRIFLDRDTFNSQTTGNSDNVDSEVRSKIFKATLRRNRSADFSLYDDVIKF